MVIMAGYIMYLLLTLLLSFLSARIFRSQPISAHPHQGQVSTRYLPIISYWLSQKGSFHIRMLCVCKANQRRPQGQPPRRVCHPVRSHLTRRPFGYIHPCCLFTSCCIYISCRHHYIRINKCSQFTTLHDGISQHLGTHWCT